MTLVSGIELPADRIAAMCRRYGVKELAVFGSASRGGMRPDSDVDVLVEFDPGARVGLVKFASLEEELEGLIGHKVDLVTKRGLKPWIRQTVLSEAQVVFPA
jgi:uncharacterized protein